MPRAEPRAAEVVDRQNALFDLHREWVQRQAEVPFFPDEWSESSDYNLYAADMDTPPEAQDAFHREARQVMGLPPLD